MNSAIEAARDVFGRRISEMYAGPISPIYSGVEISDTRKGLCVTLKANERFSSSAYGARSTEMLFADAEDLADNFEKRLGALYRNEEENAKVKMLAVLTNQSDSFSSATKLMNQMNKTLFHLNAFNKGMDGFGDELSQELSIDAVLPSLDDAIGSAEAKASQGHGQRRARARDTVAR